MQQQHTAKRDRPPREYKGQREEPRMLGADCCRVSTSEGGAADPRSQQSGPQLSSQHHAQVTFTVAPPDKCNVFV